MGGLSGTFNNITFDAAVLISGSQTAFANNASYVGGATFTTTGTVTVDSYNGLPPPAQRTLSGGTTVNNLNNATNVPYTPTTPGDWGVVPTEVGGALDYLAAAAASGGASAVGTIDSVSKAANGAVISGSAIYMQTADVTHPGLVSTSTQTFAGNKTFLNNLKLSLVTPTNPLKTDGSGNITSSLINLATDVTGILTVPNGGSGLSTISSGALLIGNGASTPTLITGGTVGYVPMWNGSTWLPSAGGGSGVTGVGSLDSQTKSADGLVILGSNIYAQSADPSFAGLVSTSTQTFAGSKFFQNFINIPYTSSSYPLKTDGSKNIVGGLISLTADVVGTLPVSNGGTGVATISSGALLIGNGTSAPTFITGGTTGYVPTWNGSTWTPQAGSGGVTTVGTIDSQSKSANGLVINGSNIYAQNADPSFPGFVSTSTQTFAGNKTFNGNVVLNLVSANYPLKSDGSKNITSSLISLGSDVTGTLAASNGGTGFSTYTDGQILIGNSSNTLSRSTLTAGSNISITNGNGSITIAATGGGGGLYVNAQEVPSGAINGSNTAYTLSQTPTSDASVKLWLDGLFQRQGTDYTISGSSITMTAAPVSGQTLDAAYTYGSTGPSQSQEVPSGTINGSNVTFTLAQTPTSNAAVSLYQDGFLMRQGTDYTISGSTITMTTAPVSGQTLDATYTY